MASYKPPADTLFGKIFKNATALFFIVIVSLFAGTFFFFKSNQSQMEDPLQNSKRFGLSQRQYINDHVAEIEVTGGEKHSAVSEGLTDASSSTHTTTDGTPSAKAIKDQSADEIRENLENQLFRKESAAGAETNQTQSFELHVYFAEVSSKGLEMLYQESRVSGQMAHTDFAQGVVNMPMTKILSYRDDFSVYAELSKPLEKNKPLDWFQGLKSAGPEGDIGLNYTIVIKDSPNGREQLEVKISKRYQLNAAEGGTKSFQNIDYIGGGELEGHRGQTYFVAEILSKFPMTSQQEYLMALSPFEIYKSQNFLNGKTFSVFFYTIENK
ncbi:MAG: hypothetical protein JNL11_13970 [Bdellovibrionaceae bacterium]|nr:hypothetical protein [Pseudobdellovibrionaceae bacterium]